MDRFDLAKDMLSTFQQFRRIMKPPPTIGGLKPSEMGVLFHIISMRGEGTEGVKVSELSSHMRVTSPSITQLVTALEERGLVTRRMDPDDRRSVLVSLTEKGEETTRQAGENLHRLFAGIVGHLGEDKSRLLIGLMDDVFQYLSTNPNIIS